MDYTAAGVLLSEEDARIAFIEQRGREIFGRDMAAWLATDSLTATNEDLDALGVRGWVTVPLPVDGLTQDEMGVPLYQVSFFSGDEGNYRKVFMVAVMGAQVISQAAFFDPVERPELSADEIAAVSARQAAIGSRADLVMCSSSINTVVIPTDDGHDVYLLGAETEPGRVLMGGHYLVRVGKDGELSTPERFTNSCVTVQKQENALAIFTTDVLHDTPTEIHVFKALSHDIQIYVSTTANNTTWNVAGDTIRRMPAKSGGDS